LSSASVVVCAGVARSFGRGGNAVVAVHGLDCRVERGDQVALTGVSGSGKSTVLQLLAGLDVPTTGSISWPALGDRTELRPDHVSVVFQGPSLIPALDATENVALPLLIGGRDPDEARRESRQMLDAIGLTPLAARLPDELSAGQAQRVAVARALVGSPSLILADEPTGQLDGATGAMVIDVLVTHAARLGAALVVATHDVRITRRLPTQWTMRDGRIETGVPCSA
jgi:ABC-type lipoprotein export system ATPase subunit